MTLRIFTEPQQGSSYDQLLAVATAAAISREVPELRENGLAGTPDEVLEKLGRLAEHGADRFYLQVLDLPDIDHLRLVADAVLPHAPGR